MWNNNKRFFTRRTLLSVFFCMSLLTLSAQPKSDTFDDALEHLPMLTTLTLKVCGVDSSTKGDLEFCANVIGSYVVAGVVAFGLKHSIHEWRPDKSDNKSFPSGHATMSFAGAHALQKEFGHVSPWIAVGGYAVAAGVSIDRVARDRHHWYDVCAGAAIGVLSTELSYYISEKLFPKTNASLAFTGNSLSIGIGL